MSRIIVYRLLENNLLGYSPMPISFEYSWKVGDIITDESGSNKCEIISIVEEKYFDFKSIKLQNSSLLPKHRYKDRDSLSNKIKVMHRRANHVEVVKYLNALNLSIEDFNVSNILRSYTRLIVNEKNITVRVVNRTEFNTLNFTYLSKYIEEDVKDVQIIFSILDYNYTYKIENESIVLFKDAKEYTLKIIHDITYWDILGRVPKYLKKLKTLQVE